jgi:hypothetical protein
MMHSGITDPVDAPPLPFVVLRTETLLGTVDARYGTPHDRTARLASYTTEAAARAAAKRARQRYAAKHRRTNPHAPALVRWEVVTMKPGSVPGYYYTAYTFDHQPQES